MRIIDKLRTSRNSIAQVEGSLHLHAFHLTWIRNRMVKVHGEDPKVDYIVKLDKIISELQ